MQMIQANAVIITAVSALAQWFFLFLPRPKDRPVEQKVGPFHEGSSGDSIEDMVVEYKQRIEGLESLGGALNGRVKALEGSEGMYTKTGL